MQSNPHPRNDVWIFIERWCDEMKKQTQLRSFIYPLIKQLEIWRNLEKIFLSHHCGLKKVEREKVGLLNQDLNTDIIPLKKLKFSEMPKHHIIYIVLAKCWHRICSKYWSFFFKLPWSCVPKFPQLFHFFLSVTTYTIFYFNINVRSTPVSTHSRFTFPILTMPTWSRWKGRLVKIVWRFINYKN